MKKYILIIFLFFPLLSYGQNSLSEIHQQDTTGLKIDSIYDGKIFKGYMVIFDKNDNIIIISEKLNKLNPKWLKKIEILINNNLHGGSNYKEFNVLLYIKKKYKKQVKELMTKNE